MERESEGEETEKGGGGRKLNAAAAAGKRKRVKKGREALPFFSFLFRLSRSLFLSHSFSHSLYLCQPRSNQQRHGKSKNATSAATNGTFDNLRREEEESGSAKPPSFLRSPASIFVFCSFRVRAAVDSAFLRRARPHLLRLSLPLSLASPRKSFFLD